MPFQAHFTAQLVYLDFSSRHCSAPTCQAPNGKLVQRDKGSIPLEVRKPLGKGQISLCVVKVTWKLYTWYLLCVEDLDQQL